MPLRRGKEGLEADQDAPKTSQELPQSAQDAIFVDEMEASWHQNFILKHIGAQIAGRLKPTIFVVPEAFPRERHLQKLVVKSNKIRIWNSIQDGMLQFGARIGLQTLERSAETPQDVQRRPISPPNTTPRRTPNRLEMAPRCLKTAPRRFKTAPRLPEDDPKRAQDRPKTAQGAPKT